MRGTEAFISKKIVATSEEKIYLNIPSQFDFKSRNIHGESVQAIQRNVHKLSNRDLFIRLDERRIVNDFSQVKLYSKGDRGFV